MAAWQGLRRVRGTGLHPHVALPHRHQPVSQRASLGEPAPGQGVGHRRVSTTRADRLNEVVWLEPFPDTLLEGVMDVPLGPEARYEQAESMSLAFVTALQRTAAASGRRPRAPRRPGIPSERGGGHARLDGRSVNSLLKRARAGLERGCRRGRRSRSGARAPGRPTSRRRWRGSSGPTRPADLDALVGMLTDDVFLSMPPLPLEYEGIEVATRFYERMIGSGRRFDLVPTRANGQPALGSYLRAASGIRHGTGLLVLTLAGRPDLLDHPLRYERAPVVRSAAFAPELIAGRCSSARRVGVIRSSVPTRRPGRGRPSSHACSPAPVAKEQPRS